MTHFKLGCLFALISCSLSSMFFVPDVTKWKNLSKNPEKKKQLTQLYTRFCRDRLQDNCILATTFTMGIIAHTVTKRITPIGITLSAMVWGWVCRNLYQHQ